MNQIETIPVESLIPYARKTSQEKLPHTPKQANLSRRLQMETKKKSTEKPLLKKRGPNGGAREGAGRPAFKPTDAERKQVEALSGYGLPIDQIGSLVRDGIHIDTLRAHFSSELQSGKAKANAQVGKTLFSKVMAGDTTAAIWWSKTQMRWSEVQKVEHTGADGSPLTFTWNVPVG